MGFFTVLTRKEIIGFLIIPISLFLAVKTQILFFHLYGYIGSFSLAQKHLPKPKG